MMPSPKELDLRATLIRVLTYEKAPSIDVVKEKAGQLAAVFNYNGPISDTVDFVWKYIDTREVLGGSIVRRGTAAGADWISNRPDIKWKYAEAYRKYLLGTGWEASAVASISNSGHALLGLLHDPRQGKKFKKYGLVIGQVQSGKTANYTSLLCSAADAGYKVLIVIAGIHNALRSQTQQRLEATFAGRSTRSRKSIGVGLEQDFPHPVTLTTVDCDFSSSTKHISNFRLTDLTKPVLLVIKKNVTTLRNVHDWLQAMNADQANRIRNAPMLMIDDEADHSSINTRGLDQDPTRTNELIRRILSLFPKAAYVGFTATPFANIFIDPVNFHPELKSNLFPSDFIHCLKAPNTYWGPTKIFPDRDRSSEYVLSINDCEDVIPLKHKKEHKVPRLPASLLEAIHQFILARAIRILRNQTNEHCSMLINVSRFVAVQEQIHRMVKSYVQDLRNAMQLHYRLPARMAERHDAIKALKASFERSYKNCDQDWKDIRNHLQAAGQNVAVLLINATSADSLSYEDHEREGSCRTIIVVGGLSLSRGLTIEGLCISYLYRNTRMYDTLMQMGRWFGYRPGYQDLCRIHLTDEAISWYTFVSRATQEVHAQVDHMAAKSCTPSEFGLWVRNHPEQLSVTARNKMLRGEKVSIDFGGRIAEFPVLPLDTALNRANEELIRQTWSQVITSEISKGWIAKNIPATRVITFLKHFCVPSTQDARKAAVIRYMRRWEVRRVACDVLLISPKGRGGIRNPLTLGVQKRADPRTVNDEWQLRGYRVASRGDEKLGLSEEQCNDAYRKAQRGNRREPIDKDYREARGIPLLMVHVISGKKALEQQRIPTLGVSFPSNSSVPAIEAVVNPVWIREPEATTWLPEYEAEQVEE